MWQSFHIHIKENNLPHYLQLKFNGKICLKFYKIKLFEHPYFLKGRVCV